MFSAAGNLQNTNWKKRKKYSLPSVPQVIFTVDKSVGKRAPCILVFCFWKYVSKALKNVSSTQ